MSFHFYNIHLYMYFDRCLIYKLNIIRKKEIVGKVLQKFGRERG